MNSVSRIVQQSAQTAVLFLILNIILLIILKLETRKRAGTAGIIRCPADRDGSLGNEATHSEFRDVYDAARTGDFEAPIKKMQTSYM